MIFCFIICINKKFDVILDDKKKIFRLILKKCKFGGLKSANCVGLSLLTCPTGGIFALNTIHWIVFSVIVSSNTKET